MDISIYFEPIENLILNYSEEKHQQRLGEIIVCNQAISHFLPSKMLILPSLVLKKIEMPLIMMDVEMPLTQFVISCINFFHQIILQLLLILEILKKDIQLTIPTLHFVLLWLN